MCSIHVVWIIILVNGHVVWAFLQNVYYFKLIKKWLFKCKLFLLFLKNQLIAASTGAIYFVAPRRCGVCIHAPPTNESGNSVRGQGTHEKKIIHLYLFNFIWFVCVCFVLKIEFCRRFVDKFNWSVLDVLYSSELDNSRI